MPLETFEAIRTRRSIGKVKPDPVPREVIQELLDAAVQAPNHHRTRPWRFWVLAGKAREGLGEAMAAASRDAIKDPESEEGRTKLAAQKAKALRAPVIIAVAVHRPTADPVTSVENLEAGAAAVQNLLLAAHARGLGAMWRTGKPAYHPTVHSHFGLDDEHQLIGFVYVGYPAQEPEPTPRTDDGKVEWWGWDS